MASIVPGRHVVALADQVGQLAHHLAPGGHRVGLAVQRQDVAAQEDVAVEALLQRAHDHVVGPRQLGGHLVAELDLLSHYGVSSSFAAPLTRLPSARPWTWGMTIAMTLPMSFGEVAPDSATASATSALSSSSEICSGR